jgi:uncharacterized protein
MVDRVVGGRVRKVVAGVLAAVGVSLALSAAPAAAADPPPGPCTYSQQRDVPATMRDGVVLRANVFTPDAPGSHPVVLMRLPYNKDVAQTYVYASPGWYASHCYVVVVQDVRGQYRSDGTFYTFRNEATDGYDTIEWAARLPKANGRVGMYGFSYPGATQWLPATLRPPHLVTIVPAMTASDYRDGWTYEGGALDLSFAIDWPLTTIANSAVRRYPDGAALDAEMDAAATNEFIKWYWHLPLRTFPPLHPRDQRVAPYFFDWLAHPSDDAYWRQWSIRRRYGQVTVPSLNFDGWYDIFVKGALENFAGMRSRGGSAVAREGTQLVVGPWLHLPWGREVGELDFGPEATNPINELQLRWFDHWLKRSANGVDTDPKVRVFVMGANRWRTADTWPLPGTRYQRWYLHSGGDANTASGDGRLSRTRPRAGPRTAASRRRAAATDRYTYDPTRPVPSIGGRFQASVPGGPFDQRPVLRRPDVLVFTSDRLRRDLEVTGPIEVTLWASSSALDTDFTAKLDDVHPDGRSILIEYGIQRARYRTSQTRPTLIRPGRVVKYTIEVWPTSNLFKAGHRIRLEISSSNFPMYDRNPNTGHAFGRDSELQAARQTIHHDARHPSSIRLPVVSGPIR